MRKWWKNSNNLADYGACNDDDDNDDYDYNYDCDYDVGDDDDGDDNVVVGYEDGYGQHRLLIKECQEQKRY